ncbi:hypothetical protein D3C72_1005370 [compost metagenome]
MPIYTSGISSTSFRFGEILKPVIGTWLMLSTPPATITSAFPSMIRSAAKAIDCSPEEQKRLIVRAGTVFG